MPQIVTHSNPFILLTDPETIIQAVERSELLARLHSRICRPLDKPLIPKQGADELRAYDQAVDQTIEIVEPEDAAGAN